MPTGSGNASIKKIAKDLIAAVHYCVVNNLPIVTVLVVQTQTRDLSDQAIQNIYNEAAELGVNTGPEPAKFITDQKIASLKLNRTTLPD